ncbi:MAG: hypothetical protein CVU89_03390 [Firmicutes bacterium HGW-Firmicutes-14]|nr:MAG: hypothetical protein CVU89_03390 [Firmicutes bacterium HGW-Firmicutes-14]
MKLMKDIPLTVNFKGKQVVAGNLLPDGTFKKTVARKQKLFALDAYGLDPEYMHPAFDLGCKIIELREKDTNDVYRISADKFKQYAVKRALGKFKPRLYCPMKYWDQINRKPEPRQGQLAFL